MLDQRTEHQNTPQTSKIDRVARIACGPESEAQQMARMALDEFLASLWRKS